MSASGIDPVQAGFVGSFARPGGNVTGLTLLVQELDGKRLQLLKELVPRLARAAFLANANSPTRGAAVKDIQEASRSLGVQLSILEVKSPAALEGVFAAIAKARADGVVLGADPLLLERHQPQIVALPLRHRLPAIYPWRQYVDQGGLVSYATDIGALQYRSATYVDKILQGASSGGSLIALSFQLECFGKSPADFLKLLDALLDELGP